MIQNEELLSEFIRKYIGWENHYKEFRLLESDIKFFSLYMKREAKSPFTFDVRVSNGMSNKAFEDLWARNGRYSDEYTIEITYAQFFALKLIITDLNGDGRRIIDEDIKSFVHYLEKHDDFTVANYINDFVDCSYSTHYVKRELNNIMGKEA